MSKTTVREQHEILDRGMQFSRIVDRALEGLPGGERLVAAARFCSRPLVNQWRREDHASRMHGDQLMVKDAFSRAVVSGLNQLHGAVVVFEGRDAGDNSAARLTQLLKESSEHHQAWSALLGTHGGNASGLSDRQLADMIKVADEDLRATAAALSHLRRVQSSRDESGESVGGEVVRIGEAG